MTSTETDQQLERARNLMVGSLVSRGTHLDDAEDAAQEVLIKISTTPSEFAHMLEHLDENGGYFVRAALNAYWMQLRSEKARRARQLKSAFSSGTGSPSVQHDGSIFEPHSDRANISLILNLPKLTEQQRKVVRLTLVDQLTPEEISQQSGTSPRAVRAMLQRAVAVIRASLDAGGDAL